MAKLLELFLGPWEEDESLIEYILGREKSSQDLSTELKFGLGQLTRQIEREKGILYTNQLKSQESLELAIQIGTDPTPHASSVLMYRAQITYYTNMQEQIKYIQVQCANSQFVNKFGSNLSNFSYILRNMNGIIQPNQLSSIMDDIRKQNDELYSKSSKMVSSVNPFATQPNSNQDDINNLIETTKKNMKPLEIPKTRLREQGQDDVNQVQAEEDRKEKEAVQLLTRLDIPQKKVGEKSVFDNLSERFHKLNK